MEILDRLDRNDVKERLFLSLCDCTEAKDRGLVREEYGPMALVPRILIDGAESTESVAVAYRRLEDLRMTEKEIFELAKENAPKIFPVFMFTMFFTSLVVVTALENGEMGFQQNGARVPPPLRRREELRQLPGRTP